MRRISLGLSVATCVVGSFSYLGAVSADAMWRFVLIAAILGAVCALLLGQPEQWPALVAAAVPVVIWSVIVNEISGETSGPAARSSVVCGLATVLAVHGARRGRTDLFAAGVVWLIAGAMLYGAAGEVMPIITLTILLVFCSIVVITAARHGLFISRWKAAAIAVAFAALSLVVITVLILSVALSSLIENRTPVVSTALREQPLDFTPPWGETSVIASPVEPLPENDIAKPALTQGTDDLARTVLIVTTIVILLLLLLGFARVLWVTRRLSRWRRHLLGLPPREAIAGSWAWTATMLRRWRWPLPPNLAVDNATTTEANWDLREIDPGKVAELARTVSTALFERSEPQSNDIRTSWALSHEIINASRDVTPLWKRFFARFESIDR